MDIWQGIILFAGGILAGFVNTLAGGGSIVTLSLLMFFGLDANVANGTNRLAIIFQGLTSSGTFRAHQMLDLKKGRLPVIAAIAGSLAGAWVAVDLNREIIEKAIAFVMISMLVFIFYKPSMWLKGNPGRYSQPHGFTALALYAIIGFYGGFIQVGIGYLLLAGLVLHSGYDLVMANALKVFITFVYSPFAFFIFVWNNQVNWAFGLVLAAGASLGAWVASRMAVSRGAGFVRWVMVVMIVLTCLQVFHIIDVSGLIGKR